jgi:hypothetical protein
MTTDEMIDDLQQTKEEKSMSKKDFEIFTVFVCLSGIIFCSLISLFLSLFKGT